MNASVNGLVHWGAQVSVVLTPLVSLNKLRALCQEGHLAEKPVPSQTCCGDPETGAAKGRQRILKLKVIFNRFHGVRNLETFFFSLNFFHQHVDLFS